MEILNRKSLHYGELAMGILNFIAIIFHGALYMLGTKYIVTKELSHTLLSRLDAIPFAPEFTFFGSIILYFILAALMYGHARKQGNKHDLLFMMAELFVTILLIMILNDSYNGVVLFVIADTLHHTEDRKTWFLCTIICMGLWLCTQNGFIDLIRQNPSISDYIALFPISVRIIVIFMRNLLTSINILIFILFPVTIIVLEHELLSLAQEKVEEAAKVNADLEHYIQLIEKIAEDKERKRIAHELHDTLGHVLAGISAGLEAGIVLLEVDSDRARIQLNRVRTSIREGTTDVRRSLQHLRPQALENNTFIEALNHMITDFQNLTSLTINFYQEWGDIVLDPKYEETIYRIVQESITNSLRHGHANTIEISLMIDEDNYYVIIQDNGTGFKKLEYGFGLTHMRERVAYLNGEVTFLDAQGFRTYIEIPRI